MPDVRERGFQRWIKFFRVGSDEPLEKRLWAGLQVLFVAVYLAYTLYLGLPPRVEPPLILILTWSQFRLTSSHYGVSVIPFAILLLAYNALGAFSGNLQPEQINVTNLIEWERVLFGGLMPPAYLQALLFDRPYTWVLDVVSNILYLSHFVLPVTLGILIWNRPRSLYWGYVLGFMVMSYVGFLTYVMFPAAPPWWANHHGYLVEELTLDHFIFSGIAMTQSPNPVSAMPSMHCAYPLYISLFSLLVWGWRALWIQLLPLTIGFAVVYLGHHYVVDALVGYVYGVVPFAVVYGLLRGKNLTIGKSLNVKS